MTDGSCQAHVMVSAAEKVVVLAQQLRHGLVFLVAHATATGCFVQLLDVWWEAPPPF